MAEITFLVLRRALSWTMKQVLISADFKPVAVDRNPEVMTSEIVEWLDLRNLAIDWLCRSGLQIKYTDCRHVSAETALDECAIRGDVDAVIPILRYYKSIQRGVANEHGDPRNVVSHEVRTRSVRFLERSTIESAKRAACILEIDGRAETTRHVLDTEFIPIGMHLNRDAMEWLVEWSGIDKEYLRLSDCELLVLIMKYGHLETAKWLVDTFGFTREDVLARGPITIGTMYPTTDNPEAVIAWLHDKFGIDA